MTAEVATSRLSTLNVLDPYERGVRDITLPEHNMIQQHTAARGSADGSKYTIFSKRAWFKTMNGEPVAEESHGKPDVDNPFSFKRFVKRTSTDVGAKGGGEKDGGKKRSSQDTGSSVPFPEEGLKAFSFFLHRFLIS